MIEACPHRCISLVGLWTEEPDNGVEWGGAGEGQAEVAAHIAVQLLPAAVEGLPPVAGEQDGVCEGWGGRGEGDGQGGENGRAALGEGGEAVQQRRGRGPDNQRLAG